MGERLAALENLVGNVQPTGAFWQGRSVLLTGHTGFKGAWAAVWLKRLGARITGFSLPPETEPSLWREVGNGLLDLEFLNDLADRDALRGAVARARPSVVLHLAAQSLVRRSYARPVETFATNTMGTIHLLDALRGAEGVEAVLLATTDKVYANDDQGRDFVEDDPLGGHDPYSASKAAAEIATSSYAAAYFDPAGVPVATARAGNVIGGGDWSEDRLVPDVWRAARSGVPLLLRAPEATRPWQHVLEPLAGYLCYVEALIRDPAAPRALNFGPFPGKPVTVAQVADAVGKALGLDRPWQPATGDHPPEMKLLSLDPTLARDTIGWVPRLGDEETVAWTAGWYAAHREGADALSLCLDQISQYQALT